MNASHYAVLERDLKGLLTDLSEVISTDEHAEVVEFIDVGEYGVALETLCGVILDGGYVIPILVLRRIADLGARMHIPSSFWEPLKTEPRT